MSTSGDGELKSRLHVSVTIVLHTAEGGGGPVIMQTLYLHVRTLLGKIAHRTGKIEQVIEDCGSTETDRSSPMIARITCQRRKMMLWGIREEPTDLRLLRIPNFSFVPFLNGY